MLLSRKSRRLFQPFEEYVVYDVLRIGPVPHIVEGNPKNQIRVGLHYPFHRRRIGRPFSHDDGNHVPSIYKTI